MENKSAKIMLAVGAGAATYKAVELASTLKKGGHEVNVVMTPDATRFVGPLSFAAVTGRAALTSVFPENPHKREQLFPHLYPANETEVFVVVPATADLIAKIASGAGDNLAACAALGLNENCTRIFCPAMNTKMWRQAAVQENCLKLLSRGWQMVGPAEGMLACGAKGYGRMSEPSDIAAAIESALKTAQSLKGRRVLILSGPTREYIDPVRYLSNGSSGLMGRALALTAARLGARVDFVSGPVARENLPVSDLIGIHKVTSAADMLAEAEKLFARADAAVFAAAVSDYSPGKADKDKLKKSKATLKLSLSPTADIAAALCAKKKAGQFAVGFALESGNGLKNAAAKLKAKGLDAIVLNGPQSMGSQKASFHYLPLSGKTENWGSLEKSLCAQKIFERVSTALA